MTKWIVGRPRPAGVRSFDVRPPRARPLFSIGNEIVAARADARQFSPFFHLQYSHAGHISCNRRRAGTESTGSERLAAILQS